MASLAFVHCALLLQPWCWTQCHAMRGPSREPGTQRQRERRCVGVSCGMVGGTIELLQARFSLMDEAPMQGAQLSTFTLLSRVYHIDPSLLFAGFAPPPVSDTKASFLAHYSRPIPAIYNVVLQELLVQQHFIRYVQAAMQCSSCRRRA